MKTRIYFFDALKAISIIWVVFCHFTVLGDTFFDNAFMTLCFVAVPIFFMVNGALSSKSSKFSLPKHFNKIISRYCVATLWRVIYLIFAVINQNVVLSAISKTQFIKYIFFWEPLPGCSVGHFWFMQTLLAIYVVSPLIYFTLKQGKNGRNILLFVITAIFITTYAVNTGNTAIHLLHEKFGTSDVTINSLSSFSPFGYGNTMLMIFMLGAVIYSEREAVQKFFGNKLKYILLILFPIFWGLMLFSRNITGGTWKWNGMIYDKGYDRIPTLLASVSLFLIFMLFEEQRIKLTFVEKIVTAISTNTLGIYYIHWIVGEYVSDFFPVPSLSSNFLKTIIVLTISLILSMIISKIPILKKMVA